MINSSNEMWCDIDENLVKTVAGTAKLKIHVTGKVNQLNKKNNHRKTYKIKIFKRS